MSKKRFGTVLVDKMPGADLPSPIVRFIRAMENREFKPIHEGDVPTSSSRHTGYHELFDEWDETDDAPIPEYRLELTEVGEVTLSRC